MSSTGGGGSLGGSTGGGGDSGGDGGDDSTGEGSSGECHSLCTTSGVGLTDEHASIYGSLIFNHLCIGS